MNIKTKIMMVVAVLMFSVGVAIAAVPGKVDGEVTKISGEMVTIKTTEGAMHSIHVDPKTTKKEGKVVIGAMVSADVNDKGHATTLTVIEGKDMEPKG